MNPAEKAIRAEIDRRETELDALRKALAALTGDTKSGAGRKAGKGTRRPKTAAEKKALSAALKAAWKKRKTAEKKADKAAG
ncbi:MAG: hypothetical protein MUC68_02870 [Burkholderiaceae bacterium]|jgi:hypothetical protein|nr:hypothetical protein [Burkholderiaceae bacterium]